MVIPSIRMDQMNSVLNEPLIERVMKFLKQQYPAETADIGDAKLHARCTSYVNQVLTLGITGSFDIIRLSEPVFGFVASLDLGLLRPDLFELLSDTRFSPEKRVDMVIMRLAFRPGA